ncbi:Sulfate-transporting ATPase [Lentibacillus sp. JNUCC-1]|uniref:ABC transporter ATP-binding protein n=1 Tax=Lentibacillus sp. JNUCC-1 TaxID=2654513 RepID=UPI0012E75A64|nr:ABC transporter ATP-binding protein [Lentibacillus sp. JNUCC-1]MUV38891.1 Sulfate-transporting ATPase [Lentibacillus sp. JNUCC-1]
MVLHVKGLSKSYGKEKVLDNLSFNIEENQIVALVGPNGSGKTTLLNIITGLMKADAGDIKLFDMRNSNPDVFKHISYMQDNSVLYDYLTGYDHLQFIGDIQGFTKQQILTTAERVGSAHYLNKKVRKYSMGMKQHLLLTMALLNQPKLLVMDEPLNGLDPTSTIRVRNLLLDLHQEGTSILLSSHNLSEIDRVTSHILFLKNGRLIEEDISKYLHTTYALHVSDVDGSVNALKHMGVHIDQIEGNTVHISTQHHSIHDVFLKLAGKQVVIHDVSQKIAGSEERYQTLFTEGT